VHNCELIHLVYNRPFASIMINNYKNSLMMACGEPKHVGELTMCE